MTVLPSHAKLLGQVVAHSFFRGWRGRLPPNLRTRCGPLECCHTQAVDIRIISATSATVINCSELFCGCIQLSSGNAITISSRDACVVHHGHDRMGSTGDLPLLLDVKNRKKPSAAL